MLDAALALAATQQGLLLRSQSRGLGISDVDVARLRRRREWRVVVRGVDVVDPARPIDHPLRCAAALLLAGAGAMLSHETVLRLSGVRLSWESERVHVCAAHVTRRSTQDVVFHGWTGTRPVTGVRRGMPSMPVADAVVATFSRSSSPKRKELLTTVVRDHHVSIADLNAAALRRGSFHGHDEWRQLLGLVELGCESPTEIDYFVLVELGFGLPRGSRQHPFRRPGGRSVGDVYYEEAKVLVEIDGSDHALLGRRIEDLRRDAELAAQGVLTLRFTGHDVRTRPGWVAATVRAAIDSRTAAA